MKNAGPKTAEKVDQDSNNFDFENSRQIQGLDPSKKTKEDNLQKFAENMETMGQEYYDDSKKGIGKDIMNDIRNSVLIKQVNDDDKSKNEKEPTLADFKMIIVLGKGTFGKVFLAEFNFNKQYYAIKVIRKDILIEYN